MCSSFPEDIWSRRDLLINNPPSPQETYNPVNRRGDLIWDGYSTNLVGGSISLVFIEVCNRLQGSPHPSKIRRQCPGPILGDGIWVPVGSTLGLGTLWSDQGPKSTFHSNGCGSSSLDTLVE